MNRSNGPHERAPLDAGKAAQRGKARDLLQVWARSGFEPIDNPPIARQDVHVAAFYQTIFFAAGGVHVPSMIEGSFSFGQYMRSIRMNLPAGAGSQFVSLSAPGDWCWM